jgi:hypothetical protein
VQEFADNCEVWLKQKKADIANLEDKNAELLKENESLRSKLTKSEAGTFALVWTRVWV